MNQYQIICIDDDREFLASLKRSLPDKVRRLCQNFDCVFNFVTSPMELQKVLANAVKDGVHPAMLISDQLMPDVTGLDLIKQIKSDYSDLVCILLTGHAELDSTRQAINHHLLDQYVCKPIEDLHEFASMIANLLKQHHLDIEEKIRTTELAATLEQVRAMQVAAEEVAMLSRSFKSLDFDEVVDVISHEVPKIFQAQCGILCLGPEGCPVELTSREHCSSPGSELFLRTDAQTVFQNNQMSCSNIPDVCSKLGNKSPDIIVPLSVGAASVSDGDPDWQGCLCMCNMDPDMAKSIDLMKYKAKLVREIISVSLTNARLYQQARHESQIDSLTGVSTRRVLEEKLEAEHSRSVRYRHSFCVVVVDVDRFKRINDKSGHAAGDQVLQRLIKILRQDIRETDTLARYGGDEFVILMPETDLDNAVNAVEKIRKKTESHLAVYCQPVTISCGVAEWSGAESESGTEVLRRADTALYKAKRDGRNNVAVEKAA